MNFDGIDPENLLISGGTGLLFKGDGFYITDYKNKKTNKKEDKNNDKNKSNNT